MRKAPGRGHELTRGGAERLSVLLAGWLPFARTTEGPLTCRGRYGRNSGLLLTATGSGRERLASTESQRTHTPGTAEPVGVSPPEAVDSFGLKLDGEQPVRVVSWPTRVSSSGGRGHRGT